MASSILVASNNKGLGVFMAGRAGEKVLSAVVPKLLIISHLEKKTLSFSTTTYLT